MRTPAFLIALAVCAVPARADLELEIQNADKITATLLPAAEIETYHVSLPMGATLNVKATPKPNKRHQHPPALVGRLLDSTGAPTGGDTVDSTGKSARVRRFVSATTATYAFEVRGDGFDIGNYSLRAKWKVPKKQSFRGVDVSTGPATVTFGAIADAQLQMRIRPEKKTGGTTHLVALERLEPDDTWTTVTALGAPGKWERVTVRQTATYRIRVDGVGATSARVDLRNKTPRKKARKVGLTVADIGDEPINVQVIGSALIDDAGGTATASGSRDPIASRTRIDVPAGGLSKPAPVRIGLAEPITAPFGTGLLPIGPAMYVGPRNTEFGRLAQVTLPYDASQIPAAAVALRVVRRDAAGLTSVLPLSNTLDDPDADTLTFDAGASADFGAFAELPAPVPRTIFPISGSTAGGDQVSIFADNLRVGTLLDGDAIMDITLNGVLIGVVVLAATDTAVTFVTPPRVAGKVTFGLIDRETGLQSDLPVNSFTYE